MKSRRIAALDVGSNTVRLLVADLGPTGRLTPLRYELRITRLAGAAGPSGLAPASIERTVAAIADFARLMRADGATAWRAVGTAALRDAPNAAALIELTRAAARLDVEVVSGDEEARLALTGVRWALGRLPGGVPDRFAVIDVGGGSTEIILWRRAGAGGSAAGGGRGVSMPVGTVRLVEGYLHSDPPAPAELAAARAAVEASLPAGLGGEPLPLVGTAGAITTLAAMDLALATYDRARIDGHRLRRPALEARLAQLAALPAAARLALPGLGKGREDLVVAGLVILLAVMERLGVGEVTVVDAGLLEGICLTSFPTPA
jgi:exopolyphosphatase/guanosine-5'-triphosphate,3'-diphosphate pyrophosphatase